MTLATEAGWASLACDSAGRRPLWTLTTSGAAPAEVELPPPWYLITPEERAARLALAVHRALRGRPARPGAAATGSAGSA